MQKNQAYKHDSPDFPIHFRNGKILVYTNPSGEVFVELSGDERVCVRISDSRDDLTITAHNSLMTPTSVNGLSAFRVWNPREKRKGE